MEKDLKVTLEIWKELMTIKLDKGYSSINAVIKDMLKKWKQKLIK